MSVSDTGLSCKIVICMQMYGEMYQLLNFAQMAACTNISMVSDTKEPTVCSLLCLTKIVVHFI